MEKVDKSATAHAQSYSFGPAKLLKLQLSCKLTSIHYMGKGITINFANDIGSIRVNTDRGVRVNTDRWLTIHMSRNSGL